MKQERRIYPLDPRELTEEQLAVVFAMTSRSPQPFDEIAKAVSAEKAAGFHERWVLNYGHSSVAEHAVLHMAVENISRLACDTLEDNRLASYTEKSSRYQVIDPGSFHIPGEMKGHPLTEVYTGTCAALFKAYQAAVESVTAYLGGVRPRLEGERDSAYDLRLRREATDNCRFLLPASTLTNVGVTMNARSLEHAVRKLLSAELLEERELGQGLKEQGQSITPTLIKYADRNDFMVLSREAQREMAPQEVVGEPLAGGSAQLVQWDASAEARVVAALLYRSSNASYEAVWRSVEGMDHARLEETLQRALGKLGPHDVPLRELEMVDYTFDLVMDYGAYREFKRHRLQTYISQPATVELGYIVPELVVEAGFEGPYREAMAVSAAGFHAVGQEFPRVAEYLVTHAHLRRVLSRMNLRECYHLFKLRTSPQAHFTLRRVMQEALELAIARHPLLFRYLSLRQEGELGGAG